jgi:hypothetical protein
MESKGVPSFCEGTEDRSATGLKGGTRRSFPTVALNCKVKLLNHASLRRRLLPNPGSYIGCHLKLKLDRSRGSRKYLLDYVIRRFNLSSAGLKKSTRPDVR